VRMVGSAGARRSSEKWNNVCHILLIDLNRMVIPFTKLHFAHFLLQHDILSTYSYVYLYSLIKISTYNSFLKLIKSLGCYMNLCGQTSKYIDTFDVTLDACQQSEQARRLTISVYINIISFLFFWFFWFIYILMLA
jgi:hypothetical protein